MKKQQQFYIIQQDRGVCSLFPACRSFLGFTPIMQVSSRTEDWVVDGMALRDHLGPSLLPIFADPNIVKVFHGADSDMVWLQRDYHLYMVNMFDTGQVG